jgi:hypothetical protein
MKDIMTNITLPADEDRFLKIKAAEAGLSKRSLATQITRDWLKEQGVKSRISDMIAQIGRMPDNEKFFQAIESLVEGSVKLVHCRVQKGVADDFGSEYKLASEEEVARQRILNSLGILRQVADIPEIDADVFSALLVEDYFKNRIR